ncbi:MAG: thioredoxin family protein [Methylotenera sp.]|nr:thioredoxin family protein [Oligoflexia bacterium]
MVLTCSDLQKEEAKLGSRAPAFNLRGTRFVAGKTEEKLYSLQDFADCKALVIIFMCNHCPYVIAVQERIQALVEEFSAQGVALIGVNSNDSTRYPADSFEAMKVRSREQGFTFPYLHDETQQVAKAYGAVCTPDPYVYERSSSMAGSMASPMMSEFLLRYHGRIDDHWKDPAQVSRRELAEALKAIVENRPVSPEQKPAMGCSIKWK